MMRVEDEWGAKLAQWKKNFYYISHDVTLESSHKNFHSLFQATQFSSR